jgi:hypothetical protein
MLGHHAVSSDIESVSLKAQPGPTRAGGPGTLIINSFGEPDLVEQGDPVTESLHLLDDLVEHVHAREPPG